MAFGRAHLLSDVPRGLAASLTDKWHGLFDVSERLWSPVYRFRCNADEGTEPMHLSSLKTYDLRDPGGDETDFLPPPRHGVFLFSSSVDQLGRIPRRIKLQAQQAICCIISD